MLVKQDYICDNLTFECYIFITENDEKLTFWFVEKDVAEFLNYKDTAIYELPAKDRITWMELRHSGQPGSIDQQDNLQDQSVFISEAGLKALISHSKKSQFTHFSEWICECVLQYVKQHNVKLADRIRNISKDVVSKPQTSGLLQCVVICEYLDSKDGKRWYYFIRRQQQSMAQAIKDLSKKHAGLQEIFRLDYTPNGIYSFNCLKEYLKQCDIGYDARNNKIHFFSNDISSEQLICIFKNVCCLNRI